MNSKELYREILFSKRRCASIGLKNSINFPLVTLNKECIKAKLNENMELINVFRNCISNIIDAVKEKYIFLLTDQNGCLLSLLCDNNVYRHIDKFGFKIGTYFTENSLGTNAISMAINVKRCVFLTPQDHYCDILKKWYCIASPLIIDEKTIGYLDVSTIEHNMAEEMVALTELLVYQIENEYKKIIGNEDRTNIIKFSKEQLKILKLITKGYKDSAIASELKISINTVNYHKRNIFKKLGVLSTREAIVKAIQMHLVEID
ncbi:LuxR C-terminal-related transcriptional regulator [Thermoanaerobacterium thermosaccharolyticum]|uniref:LuxR family transcriptional regulator n=1 Tax=Thermoanaerobacterium thermosaccharolyticum TaxID=1517 RepID=UPI00279A41F1|nr:LuxR C-terminal-related transcriptional regulator [Thermoanaerobacterium thermosaccharolyticum]